MDDQILEYVYAENDALKSELIALKEENKKLKEKLAEANAKLDFYDAESEQSRYNEDPYDYYGVRRSDF